MNENIKQDCIKLVGCFLLGFLCCYTWLGERESAEMGQIRAEYQRSTEQCRELSDQLSESRKRLEAIQDSIGSSAEGIRSAEGQVGAVRDGMRTDADRLRECQQIISELRKNYESKNP